MRWLLPFTLSCGLFAQAAPTYRLPSHGFLPFSGDDPEAIFTTRDLIIGNSSILNGRDNRGSTLRFVGTRANPPVFSTPYPTPVSLYSGNPDQWRHRQSTYARVQLGEWYPGISAEWNMENDAAVLRLDVSPGVDPRILRIYSDDGTYGSCRLFGVEITCTAYQADAAGHRTTIPINFEFVRDQPSVISFGGIHAPNAPITLEFRFRRGNEVSDAKFAADGSLFLLHEQGFVKFDPQGTPLFETRFRGLLGIRLVLSDSQSIIVIGGLNRFDRGSPNWPALPEPRQRFVAQFDPRGQIVSGLYGSGLIFAAFAANGDMVLGKAATGRPDYSVVGRWTPGRAALDTETFLPGDLHNLAANPTGHVTCLLYPRSRSVGSASTTPGALEQTYRGQHQLYAVNLTPDLSRQVWATFLPMLPNAEGMNGLRVSGMELDANGELLVAATATYPYTFGGSWEGTANVLHRLAADGSRYVYSESLPGSDFRLILHRDDSVWVHGRAPKNNLPTSPQAPLRGGCYGLLGSYVASRSRTGTFLQGSYLRDGNAITVSPSGQYLYQWRRSDPAVGQFAPTALDSAGGTPAFACPPLAAPGALVTVFGQGLGPVDPQSAVPVDGHWPLELAGVRAFINGEFVGLVAVQHGFVKFHAPANLPVSARVPISIEYNSGRAEGVAFVVRDLTTLITTDGSEFGPLAAVHADGTMNSPSNPAKRGSIVTLFATGLDARDWRVEFSPFGEARTLYRGPAPGLPGVTQFNVEVPATAFSQAAVGLTPLPIVRGAINVSSPRTTIAIEPEPRAAMYAEPGVQVVALGGRK